MGYSFYGGNIRDFSGMPQKMSGMKRLLQGNHSRAKLNIRNFLIFEQKTTNISEKL